MPDGMTGDQVDRIIALLESIDSKLSTPRTTENETFTGKEAATFMNISYYTLLNLVKTGEVPYKRIGKKLIFQKEALNTYLSTNEYEKFEPLEQARNPLKQVQGSKLGQGYGQLRKLR